MPPIEGKDIFTENNSQGKMLLKISGIPKSPLKIRNFQQ